jgi:hypothetical protein
MLNARSGAYFFPVAGTVQEDGGFGTGQLSGSLEKGFLTGPARTLVSVCYLCAE